ncbi:MAG: hypothetical protein GY809_07810 [Planctomycetes bacterium]|nr:hypothetical protein [Planctomycetota bacterium]
MEMKSIAVCLVCVCCLASCTPTDVDGPEENDPVGVYTLITVNGSTLPATVSHGDHEVKVRSGVFTINADGTCTSKTVFGPPSGDKEISREVNATYTQEGSTLNMTWQGAGKTKGIVEGHTFTMNNEGMMFLYQG